jgi:hypothetical protein
MDGTPPALPTDSEDVVWALQTAESLWKRGERVDAVVWVRRAAQAAGELEDAKRAATLARCAADLGDWIASHTITGGASQRHESSSLQALDALLDADPSSHQDSHVLSSGDVEIVSARDFEAGFSARSAPPTGPTSEGEVMTVSLHAPDVEIIEEAVPEFDEEEPTPVQNLKSPSPPVDAYAEALDPWKETDLAGAKPPPTRRSSSSSEFAEDEVVTSAKQRSAAQPPPAAPVTASVPAAPRTPVFPIPIPRARPAARPAPEPEPSPSPAPAALEVEAETTTYKQINPRASRGAPAATTKETAPPLGTRPKAPPLQSGAMKPRTPPAFQADARAKSPPAIEARPQPPPPVAARKLEPPPPSAPPPLDLLEMVDSVVPPVAARAPHPSAAPTPSPPKPAQVSESARPTAPPPSGMTIDAMPSAAPTRPHAGATLLDLDSVEALGDLPDDAREAFAQAAKIHGIALDEEVSHFALALVVEGDIDVSATIVDAPALRLTKNAVLRSRGTLVPGVGLRLVCASDKATIATWDDAAVTAAFRTCPWVEEDLRAVADRVQAKAGLTMGPLGERFDISLREHLTSKLTLRTLAPGEILVAQGKPVGILIVGIGDITLTKKTGERAGTARPGDFVFPNQTLAHGVAPETAAAGEAGAVVLVGDRATAQDLLMTMPPLLEVLAML